MIILYNNHTKQMFGWESIMKAVRIIYPQKSPLIKKGAWVNT